MNRTDDDLNIFELAFLASTIVDDGKTCGTECPNANCVGVCNDPEGMREFDRYFYGDD